MSDTIPDWAIERAKDLRDAGFQRGDKNYTHTFARYIAEHEEPPVDPLLIEAREIAARRAQAVGEEAWSRRYLAGEYDGAVGVQCALRGLKRGVELEREKSQ